MHNIFCTLSPQIIHIKHLGVYIRLPDGRTILVEIENVSPVRYIKDQVHVQEGIPPNRQLLKVQENNSLGIKTTPRNEMTWLSPE